MAKWIEDPSNHIMMGSVCALDTGTFGSREDLARDFGRAGKFVEDSSVFQHVLEALYPTLAFNIVHAPPNAKQLRMCEDTDGRGGGSNGSIPGHLAYLSNTIESTRATVARKLTLVRVTVFDGAGHGVGHFQAGIPKRAIDPSRLLAPASAFKAVCVKTGCTKSFHGIKNKCLYCQGVVHAGCSFNLRFSFNEKKGTESICGPCYENLGKPAEPLCANVHPSDAQLLQALYKDRKTKFINMIVTSL